MIKKIIIGCDHLGRELKDSIKEHLISQGIEVNDIGVNSDDAVAVSYTHLTLPTTPYV